MAPILTWATMVVERGSRKRPADWSPGVRPGGSSLIPRGHPGSPVIWCHLAPAPGIPGAHRWPSPAGSLLLSALVLYALSAFGLGQVRARHPRPPGSHPAYLSQYWSAGHTPRDSLSSGCGPRGTRGAPLLEKPRTSLLGPRVNGRRRAAGAGPRLSTPSRGSPGSLLAASARGRALALGGGAVPGWGRGPGVREGRSHSPWAAGGGSDCTSSARGGDPGQRTGGGLQHHKVP